MGEVDISLSLSRSVARDGRRIFFRGTIFRGDSLVDGIHEFLSIPLDKEPFLRKLEDLNGFFFVAIEDKDRIIAAVDRTRSFPLFYSLKGNDLLLGDNPYWIQEKYGDRQTDGLAFAELYLTGYVTGDSTFDPRIRQIPAGELLIAERDGTGGWHTRREGYYRFHHHDEFSLPFEELLTLSQEVMDSAVRRMIEVANGSLIAVPLSGGYDSRFILLTLKRLGYANLLTFSYGLPGNSEAEVSRKVAVALGVPWHFVPYNPERWQKWLECHEFARYQKVGERMVSVAHIQDWPATWQLSKNVLLPERTLFAPGHSGDFLGGKQTRPRLLRKGGWNKKQVVNEIWERHYTNVSLNTALRESGLGRGALLALYRKAEVHLDGWNVESLEGANNAYNCEFWQEKLSKFLVNSMTAYEFWGYRWWLPFYDKEFVAFWERVPLVWRRQKILYDRTVEKLQNGMGLNSEKHHLSNKICKNMKGYILQYPLIRQIYWKVYGRRKMLNSYILGILKAMPKEDFYRYLGNGGNINGYLAALHHKRYLIET